MDEKIKDTEKVYFEESQRFRQNWVWVAFIVINISMIALAYQALQNDEANGSLVLSLVLVAGLNLLFWYLRLDTQLTSEGINWRWSPFQRSFRQIKWTETSEVYLREYRPLSEFGGWGIRFGFHGRAYNVAGDKGIQIVYKNGSRLLIGTQKPEHMQNALKKISKNQFLVSGWIKERFPIFSNDSYNDTLLSNLFRNLI